ISVDFNRQAFAWGRTAAHDMAAVQKLAGPKERVAQVIEFKRHSNAATALDELIAHRAALLTDYQNGAYARQYLALVEQVRLAESTLSEAGKPLRLTAAVARYFYKLMAYKDEYEVARLHTDPAFADKIAGMFEGDYTLKFHLAPPLWAKRDANGHLIKKEFGPWMMHAFRWLAKLKFLRGTALDIFGYAEERKIERALIEQYRQSITALLPKMTADNVATLTAIAGIPEYIRGYGHVKQQHLKEAKEKELALLAVFNSTNSPLNTPQADGRQAT
ncbi:MAG: DUF6537 domain-containing protein, partial [Burkholderiales bacterium]